MPGQIDRQIEDHRRDTDPHPRWKAQVDAQAAALQALIDSLTTAGGTGTSASNAVPTDATTSDGQPGTSEDYARSDHQHRVVLPEELSAILDMIGVGVVHRDDNGVWYGLQQTPGRVAVWDEDGIGGGNDDLSYDGAKLTAPSLLATDQAGAGERAVVAKADGTQRAVSEIVWDGTNKVLVVLSAIKVANAGSGGWELADRAGLDGKQAVLRTNVSGLAANQGPVLNIHNVLSTDAVPCGPQFALWPGALGSAQGAYRVIVNTGAIWQQNRLDVFSGSLARGGWDWRDNDTVRASLTAAGAWKLTSMGGAGIRAVFVGTDGTQQDVDEFVWNATTGLSLIKSVSASYFGFSTQNTSNGAAATATWSVINNASVAALAEAYSSGNSGTEGGIARANCVGFLGQGASLAAVFIGVHSATSDAPVYFIHKANKEAEFTSAGWTFRQRVKVTADIGTGARMLTATAADGKHTPVDAVTWTGTALAMPNATLTRTTDATTTEVVRGDDTRMTNARTPTAHAASHQSGGGDAMKLDDLSAPDDNTDLNATTTRHGLLPKLGGGTSKFLREDGTWETPSGGGQTLLVVATSDAGQSSIDSATDLQFEDESVDTDSAWSGTAFTAPSAGRYIATVSVKLTGSGDYDTIAAIVGSSVVAHSAPNIPDLHEISGTFVLNLAASDVVKFRLDRLPGYSATRSTSAAHNRLTIMKV